jgi:hypothetical protein
MHEDQKSERPPPEVGKPPHQNPKADGVAAPANEEMAAAQKLTPEEQMALFEKELKEKDWGHQPC